MVPLVNGLVVGGLTSILENALRWIGFKVNGKGSRSFRSAVAFGIGHGGIELAITGFLLAVSLATVLFYNPGAEIAKGTTTSAVQSTLSQIASYWASPWYYGPLTLFEHLVTFASQLVLAIMVWRSVAKGQLLWLLWAVLYQTVTEGVTTFLSGMNWGLWDIEGVLALFLLLNLLMLYLFWSDEGGLDSEPEDEDDEDDEEDGDESDEESADEENTSAEEGSPAE